MKKLLVLSDGIIMFYCPGCKCNHCFDPKQWTWNGDYEKPTVSPSIRTKWVKIPDNYDQNNIITDTTGKIIGTKNMVCHLFMKDGALQYLGDCTHELKGKTVPMEEIK